MKAGKHIPYEEALVRMARGESVLVDFTRERDPKWSAALNEENQILLTHVNGASTVLGQIDSACCRGCWWFIPAHEPRRWDCEGHVPSSYAEPGALVHVSRAVAAVLESAACTLGTGAKYRLTVEEIS